MYNTHIHTHVQPSLTLNANDLLVAKKTTYAAVHTPHII
jgi:hypothetical protein